MSLYFLFFFEGYVYHRDLHGLTHSFPTRRSSELADRRQRGARRDRAALRCSHGLTSVTRASSSATTRSTAFAYSTVRVIRTPRLARSEEHTSELQSLMRILYAVFCLKTKQQQTINTTSSVHTQKIAKKNRS